MDAREELAGVIRMNLLNRMNATDAGNASADAILAAGYRKMPDREILIQQAAIAIAIQSGAVNAPIGGRSHSDAVVAVNAILALMEGNK